VEEEDGDYGNCDDVDSDDVDDDVLNQSTYQWYDDRHQ
jgi:hypothetical protein